MSNNDVVIINLDRPRALKFTHTAMKTIEELTGKTIAEIDEQMDLLDSDLREKAVFCGLLKDAKDKGEILTLDRIPELLDEAPSLIHILNKISSAWRVAFGAPAESPEGNLPAPAEQPEAMVKETPSTGKKVSE